LPDIRLTGTEYFFFRAAASRGSPEVSYSQRFIYIVIRPAQPFFHLVRLKERKQTYYVNNNIGKNI
jgi:hypothetical protein